MQRITTTVDNGVYARLEELARRDRAPVARLIREAMERYVTEREEATEPRPLPDWVGMLEGPGDDLASRSEDILDNEYGRFLVEEIERNRTAPD